MTPAGTTVARSTDGTRLHAVAHGPEDAPTVLLLPGVGSSSQFVLEAFADPLASAGWRLVAADLRGHGAGTPLPDPAAHAFGRHVEDVAALAERVAPEVLGGVSLGGHAAVGAALAGVPCRAVVACLPAWTGRAVPGRGPHAAVADEVRRRGVTGMVERFRQDTDMLPWLREVLVREWARHDPASLAAALVALDGGLAPTSTELSTLAVPLGLVGWPDDPGHPWAVARSWASTAPRAHLEGLGLADVEAQRSALGHAATESLAALGVQP